MFVTPDRYAQISFASLCRRALPTGQSGESRGRGCARERTLGRRKVGKEYNRGGGIFRKEQARGVLSGQETTARTK